MHARRTAALWLTASLFASSAIAEDSKFELDIPAQSLKHALGALAEQTGLQVVYQADLADGLSSPAVKGELTASEALARMLRGTGLGSRFLNERAIAISAPSVHAIGATTIRNYSMGPLRLAQAGADVQLDVAQPLPPEPAAALVELEEITVTGSHIRGAGNTSSPVTTLSREEIDRRGYTTVQDILKTVTASTGIGPSEVLQSGTEAGTAFNSGGSINLRGLGASSTLVLVDGRRQAGGGLEARYTDVSSIPSTAIERIEVLTDGASAVYGSDAVAGVVNILLRKDFEGAETRVQFGDASGGADEVLMGQLVGTAWKSGHAMLSYQYWNRDALPYASRRFTADSDKRPLGGENFSLITSNPGNILSPTSGAPAFSIPRGQDGTGLEPSDLLPGVINYQNRYAQADLLPNQKMHSVFAAATQRIGERLELQANGSFSQRDLQRREAAATRTVAVPPTNPFYVDPFGAGRPINIAYSFNDDLGPQLTTSDTTSYAATFGGTVSLNADWTVDAYTTYSSEQIDWHSRNLVNGSAVNRAVADTNPDTAFNPFGEGSHTNAATLDTFRMTQIEEAASSTWSTNVTAQGGVFDIPGGSVKLALGADYRKERLDRRRNILMNTGGLTSDPSPVDRGVSAAFAEVQLPLMSAANRRVGVERLTLSVAGRYEEYSDFGSAFNPKLGISWSPVAAINVRGTIGTSFRAPNLLDINENPILYPNRNTIVLVTDPQSASGFSKILSLGGTNQSLKEERATTWTAGIDLEPSLLGGVSLSLTYFNIVYKDHIERGGPASIRSIFNEEDRWAPIITRNPPRDLVERLCSEASFSGSREDCLTGDLPTIVDARVRNLGELHVQGIDTSLRFPMKSDHGDFQFGVDGSYLLQFDQATTVTSPFFDLVDTLGGPVKLRLRASAGWTLRGVSADIAVMYLNSYTDKSSSPVRSIDSYTTVDARLAYKFSGKEAWVDGTEIALSAINLLDEYPPFVNINRGYDTNNASPVGRTVAIQLIKSW